MSNKITLNQGQTEALELIKQFLASKETEFLLEGAAGTGKTFLLKQILKHYNNKVTAIAPSHKAKKVLAKSLGFSVDDVRTVASALIITLNENTGEFKINEYLRKTQKIPIKQFSLVILDECSMVSDAIHKEITDTITPGTKVIYVGDKSQLPPIGQETDSDVFNIKNKYLLTQKMRQLAGSPIIKIGELITENINSDNIVSNPIKPEHRVNIIDELSKSSICWINNYDVLIDSFISDFKNNNYNSNYVKMVTFNNENHKNIFSVGNLNKEIRKRLYGSNAKELVVGELLVAYDSFVFGKDKQPTFYNSDEFFIKAIEYNKTIKSVVTAHSSAKGTRKYPYEYKVNYLTLETENKTTLSKKIPVIAEESLTKYKDDLDKLYKTDVQMALLLSKNFANLQYGYCSTAHKAQGSTYTNTYVIEDNIMGEFTNMSNNKAKNQALYVAVSRPTTKLVMFSENNL
jgi:ATP-dependent exoDNAse (exonuclease V) alpha subunit